MKTSFHLILFLCGFVILWLQSCQSNDNESITIRRFDKELHNVCSMTKEEKSDFIESYKDVFHIYIDKVYPDTNMTVTDKLDTFANSNAINFFYPEVEKQFSDISTIEKELGQEKRILSDKYGIGFPSVYSAIIPYNQSIISNGSIAIIGLNHYLGTDYKPYEYFPEYKRRFKIKEKIKYDLTEALLKIHFPFEPDDNTVLENMIYEGLIAYLAETIIPDYEDSLYFSFSSKQLSWCIAHERQIWEQLLIDDILYSTSGFVKSALLKPAPFSEHLTRESPGQTCCWIGKSIVESYLSNNKAELKYLLETKAYQDSQTFLFYSIYDGRK